MVIHKYLLDIFFLLLPTKFLYLFLKIFIYKPHCYWSIYTWSKSTTRNFSNHLFIFIIDFGFFSSNQSPLRLDANSNFFCSIINLTDNILRSNKPTIIQSLLGNCPFKISLYRGCFVLSSCPYKHRPASSLNVSLAPRPINLAPFSNNSLVNTSANSLEIETSNPSSPV